MYLLFSTHARGCLEAGEVAPMALAMGSTARSQGKAGAESRGSALRCAWGSTATARTLKSAIGRVYM